MNVTQRQRRVFGVILIVIGVVAIMWDAFSRELSGSNPDIAGVPLRLLGSIAIGAAIVLLLGDRFRRPR